MKKLNSSKTCLKMDSGGMHPTFLLDLTLPALITMPLATMATSRFGFSMMWGKFCQNCFEKAGHTALA